EKQEGFANGHVQNLVNVFALVQDLEDAALVSRAFTFLADEFNVRQKLHLYSHSPVALAHFAPAAWNIERETAGVISACLRFARCSENVAYVVEGFDVGDRIGAGSTADRALIDEHHVGNPLRPGFDDARSQSRIAILNSG